MFPCQAGTIHDVWLKVLSRASTIRRAAGAAARPRACASEPPGAEPYAGTSPAASTRLSRPTRRRVPKRRRSPSELISASERSEPARLERFRAALETESGGRGRAGRGAPPHRRQLRGGRARGRPPAQARSPLRDRRSRHGDVARRQASRLARRGRTSGSGEGPERQPKRRRVRPRRRGTRPRPSSRSRSATPHWPSTARSSTWTRASGRRAACGGGARRGLPARALRWTPPGATRGARPRSAGSSRAGRGRDRGARPSARAS